MRPAIARKLQGRKNGKPWRALRCAPALKIHFKQVPMVAWRDSGARIGYKQIPRDESYAMLQFMPFLSRCFSGRCRTPRLLAATPAGAGGRVRGPRLASVSMALRLDRGQQANLLALVGAHWLRPLARACAVRSRGNRSQRGSAC
ncbi:hypothetical protein [Xanthomonas maliensis]|uniref:hypothetical protein n=1 Tax=Xanthomonas maliensis TaxID=1321368 RepID=UPI0003B52C68|nr:hypothetical protein [Xanthomonas maliensis]KAB7772408.1 hypothetical protein CKY51_00540 [Xanthomonas maliensis]